MVTQEQINEIIKEIVENFKPQKVILFGSYANGTPTEESDLDLLIIKDGDLPSRLQNRKVRKILSGLKETIPANRYAHRGGTEPETVRHVGGLG